MLLYRDREMELVNYVRELEITCIHHMILKIHSIINNKFELNPKRNCQTVQVLLFFIFFIFFDISIDPDHFSIFIYHIFHPDRIHIFHLSIRFNFFT